MLAENKSNTKINSNTKITFEDPNLLKQHFEGSD